MIVIILVIMGIMLIIMVNMAIMLIIMVNMAIMLINGEYSNVIQDIYKSI